MEVQANKTVVENNGNFKNALERDLSIGKQNLKHSLDKNEQIHCLNEWLNLLKSKSKLLQILGKIGEKEFNIEDTDEQIITTLKNLAENIRTNKLEAKKLKLAALSSVVTALTANKQTKHENLYDLLQKKHELGLEVEQLSKEHSQLLVKLIETKKEIVKETDSFKKEISNDGQKLAEMNKNQPSTIIKLKHKTQEYIRKANEARKLISTIIVAGDVNLIEKPELLELLVKQRLVITVDNLKNW